MPDCDPDVKYSEMIHAAIQTVGSPDPARPSVLVGFALVCDWHDTDGRRWLSQSRTPHLPVWQADALLHAALDEQWETEDD